MATVLLEIEIVPIADEMEADLEYFQEDLREFFEHFGWKVLKINGEEE